MKNKILFIVFWFISIIAMSQSLSPELVSSSGNHFSNTSYQLDWSIGEPITLTHSSATYIITQGFHQENYETIGVADFAINLEIQVFPNPTTDFIAVVISEEDLNKVSNLRITNVNGKVLLKRMINTPETRLNFSEYASGIYFLFVKNNNQIITSYKIVKK